MPEPADIASPDSSSADAPPSAGRRAVAFLTAPPELGARVMQRAREHFDVDDWTAYYRASEAVGFGSAFDGVEALSDKPPGSKLAFLRLLRESRFDIGVVAWTGHHNYDRMKAVALLSGARKLVACNERLEFVELAGWRLLWVRHARWRPTLGDPHTPVPLVALRVAYKWTVGLAIGAGWLLLRSFQAQRRTMRALRETLQPGPATPQP
ncbi:MAG: hypothetical protein AAF628_21640 [Planctomycetota bacterium]